MQTSPHTEVKNAEGKAEGVALCQPSQMFDGSEEEVDARHSCERRDEMTEIIMP